MTTIYKRELRAYLTDISGYVFIAFTLLVTGIYATANNFLGFSGNFEYVLGSISFVFLITVPILTMRIFADERRQKTLDFSYSLPLKLGQIILGKYLAAVTMLLICCAVMLLYPPVLSLFGPVNVLTGLSAVFGFFLLGSALIAIGLFASALTENTVISALICFLFTLLSYIMSTLSGWIPTTAAASYIGISVIIIAAGAITYFITGSDWMGLAFVIIAGLPLSFIYMLKPDLLIGAIQSVLNALSGFDYYTNFIHGIFDLTSVVYYLSIICVFLSLCFHTLEKRRWS